MKDKKSIIGIIFSIISICLMIFSEVVYSIDIDYQSHEVLFDFAILAFLFSWVSPIPGIVLSICAYATKESKKKATICMILACLSYALTFVWMLRHFTTGPEPTEENTYEEIFKILIMFII